MDRSLTMLNENGDTTITWSAEQDDAMIEVIARKMKAGVAFYLIGKPGPRGGKPKVSKIKDAEKAREHRALTIKDEDFAKFVLEGKGEAIYVAPPGRIEGKRATKAEEVAQGHSVGVKPRKAG